MDKFSQLVDDLNTNKLCLKHIQNAVRMHIRQRTDLPEGIKDLLGGRAGVSQSAGLIFELFALLEQIVGNLELAYRRGSDVALIAKKKGRDR